MALSDTTIAANPNTYLKVNGTGTDISFESKVIQNLRLDYSGLTDHTYSGIIVELTAGAALAFPNIVYMGSDSRMELSDADATTSMPAIALCTTTIAENAAGDFLLSGFVRDDTWNWTPGALLYADNTTAGGIVTTAPAGSGDQVQVIGLAITADIIYFNPSLVLVEVV